MAESGSYDEATLARRYAMAQKLMEQKAPIKHWAEGLGSLAESALGGYQISKLDAERKAEKAQEKSDLYTTLGLPAPAAASVAPEGGFQKLAALLNGGGGGVPAAPAPPVAAPAGPPSDQASYAPPPAPAPTTFRPGITAPVSPATPAGAPDYSKAIAGIESGGAYDKLGPQTKTGDRAYGKYQVMGANVPEWTTQVLGKPMTPEQFLSNPDAQEAVFKAKFGDYVQKYGPEGAAKAWFAGEKGMNNPNARDVLGTTVQGYGQKFTQALGPQAAPTGDAALPPGATPAQGALPTAEAVRGGVLAGVPQESKLQIARLLSSNNPTAKAMGTALLQSAISGEKVTHIDLGNKVGIMDNKGNVVRTIDKGEPNKGPEFGVIGKDEFGNERYGWRDPRDKSTTPAAPQGATQPTITGSDGKPIPIAPGIDPKVIREAASKRAAEEGMPADTKTVSALRNEIQGLPSYKNVAQAAPVYKSMMEAAGRDTRAADVNMIYGMAKIMDPGSVVRESEMSVAQAIATLPQQLQAAIKSQMTESGRLTPELRAQIMQEARSRITAYQGMFDQDAGMYRGIAQRGRMNEADVLPTFGPFDEFKPPAGPAVATPTPKGVDPKIWQHMTPEERSLWK